MKKRFFTIFCVIELCCLITSCHPPIASSSGQDQLLDDEVKQLVIESLKTAGPYERTYLAGENVDSPQEKDQRIDTISFAGEESTGETTGVAFLVKCSYYNTWHPEDTIPSWRENETGLYVILGRDANGQYYEVRGTRNIDENEDISEAILEVSYDLMDIDVALWREGYSSPVGPGSEINIFCEENDGAPTVKILEGWEPIYQPGDYWSEQSWDGFSAITYCNENTAETDANTYQVYTIDTTRTDLYTDRGIHVGSTREEVLEAYPDIFDTHYWHDEDIDFPGSDYLWYCDDPEGFGAAILFFFSGDVVSQIRLNNMFN